MRVCVTGGAGFIGSRLVPKLLGAGYEVTILDLYLYGDLKDAPESTWYGDPQSPANRKGLREINGDIRDPVAVKMALEGCNAVIHLACISNDPSFDLDPGLGRSINYDCFRPLVRAAKAAGAERFIYASSSAVYGIKDAPEVTEDLPLNPISDYAKYKALCEPILLEERDPGFTTVILRPATVCGYAPRLRLDLTVNILTSHAYFNRVINVFGGNQLRPNLHIEDMTDLYLRLLEAPEGLVAGKIWNAGTDNLTIREIAEMVQERCPVPIATVPSNDKRSYRVSSEKIRRELGWAPKRTVGNAIEDLIEAFSLGYAPDAMHDDRYYNIKRMQALHLK